jgi:methylmalonyl-CoA mutase
VIRATPEEKGFAIDTLRAFQRRNAATAPAALASLQQAAVDDANLFESLMEVTKVASLGQISHALYQVGGRYRRNM